MTEMRPVNLRVPDHQYHDLLSDLLTKGREVMPQQDEKAFMVVGRQWHFDLENGFPLVTERDLSGKFFEQALGELIGFLHGARTLKELERFGCRWWKKWATPEKCSKRGLEDGDLGPGSYGAAWRTFPTAEGESFDQITSLIAQLTEKPHLRTHFVSPWVPQYVYRIKGRVQKVVVVPCHGWFHVFLFPETRELVFHHFQRSADVPVGLVFNMVQYASLAIMLAQVMGYTAKELVYTISDAHMYESQIEAVKTLLSRRPTVFPTLTLDPSVKDIFSFRPEHFKLSDYNPHPGMVIPTPV